MKVHGKIILSGVVFVALCVAAVPLLRFKARRAVEVYKRQLVERGEKLSMEELVSASSTNAEARAEEFLQSAQAFSPVDREWVPSPMRMISPGRSLVSSRSDDLYDETAWNLVRTEVETKATATAALRAMLQRGEIVFPLDPAQGFRTPQPHLGPMRNVISWLAMATVLELREGNKPNATENLKTLLLALENYKGEPAMMSQFVRAMCVQIAFGATWEVLQSPGWSDRDLAEIQKAWSAVRFDSGEEFFALELASGSARFEAARKSAEIAASFTQRGASVSLLDDLTDFATEITSNPGVAFQTLMNRPNQRLWRWVISYEEELDALKLWFAGLEAERAMERQVSAVPSLKTLEAQLEAMGSQRGFLLGETGNLVRSTVGRLSSARIAGRLAITACALHRCKLQTGRYPDSLKELAPKFLSEIPIDPVDGAPVRYRRNADASFHLYSVGENGVDDGGNPEPDPKRPISESSGPGSRRMRWSYLSRGRDWVWPQPATRAEILQWRVEEAKKAR